LEGDEAEEVNAGRLKFILDGLDWDRVTEKECGVLCRGKNDTKIKAIYREKKDRSYSRFLFQKRRKAERERWER
jgi:hypothetical protein